MITLILKLIWRLDRLYKPVSERKFNSKTLGAESATQSSSMITLFWKDGVLIARAEYFKNVFLIWEGKPHFLSVLN